MTDDRRVIVIGSGPTGAVAALALLRAGIPVTMLESGQALPDGALVRLAGKNVYRKRSEVPNIRHLASGDADAYWYHALHPGGLSNYWTGAVPRFAPEDFFEGERLHERYRWPVSYEDLVPYYEYVEGLMGVVGDPRDVLHLPASHVTNRRSLPGSWHHVARHAEALGHGLTILPRADVSKWMVTRSGAAFNSFTRIIPLLQKFPHFELRLGAHALRLEWSGQERRVHSVHYFDRANQSEQRIAGSAVVVAAGPLASTKLLLDSSCSDFPQGLGDTQGLLGRYLHDHPKDWCVVELDKPLPRLEHNAYLTRARYEDSQPLLAAGWTLGNVTTRDKLLSIGGWKTKVFGTQIFGTIVPTEENYVRLHTEATDEFGLPKLEVNIRFDEDVLRNMSQARQRLVDVFAAAGHRGTIQWHMPKLRPGDSVHYGGTIRMHSSPKYGLLNAWNRLYEVGNVVVADASSFTTGAEKNPTVTAMALAVRAAHRLAGDLRTSSLIPSRSHANTPASVR